jgi:hypothetical protein
LTSSSSSNSSNLEALNDGSRCLILPIGRHCGYR